MTTCRELCTLLCKKPLKDKIDQEAEEIGGPLKAHGFLRCMTRMDILMEVKAGTQGSLQLGVTKKHYKLTATTDTTKRKVQQWLDLHDTVHCILAFEAPDTLEKWNVLSDLLKDALKKDMMSQGWPVGLDTVRIGLPVLPSMRSWFQKTLRIWNWMTSLCSLVFQDQMRLRN